MKVVCKICQKEHDSENHNDTNDFYVKYRGDKVIDAICNDCWDKGNRWENK